MAVSPKVVIAAWKNRDTIIKWMARGCFTVIALGILIITVIFGSISAIFAMIGNSSDVIDTNYNMRNTAIYQYIKEVYTEYQTDLSSRLADKAQSIIDAHTVITIDEESGLELKSVTVSVYKQQNAIPYALIFAYLTVVDLDNFSLNGYEPDKDLLWEFFETITPIEVTSSDSTYTVKNRVLTAEEIIAIYFPEEEDSSFFETAYGAYSEFLVLTITNGYTSEFDVIGYLSCKYESGGDPDNVGGDNGNAYGKYQLDYRYDLGDFIDWAYAKDSTLYAEFAPFVGLGTSETLRANEDLYAAWHAIYARDPLQFEADQDEFFMNVYYMPSKVWLLSTYGIDLDERSDALKAVIFSHAVRNGPASSLKKFLTGVDNTWTDEEIIAQMYAISRTVHPSQVTRWTLEEEDAYGLLYGTLDIYEPSSNAAGSIDWSYKVATIEQVVLDSEISGIALEDRMTYLFPAGVPTTETEMAQYLITITVPYITTDGEEKTMSLTVHKKLANDILAAFEEMMALGFPINASETYCYGWRTMVSSSTSLSHHSYGVAIDINSSDNPYISDTLVVGSNSYEPGVNPLSVTDEVVAIWKRHGFYWGGDWTSAKDYMHFTYTNH